MIDQRINVQASFNGDFCSVLEYHLTNALMNAAENKWESFWCDGVYEPEINQQFTARNITSIKQIITQAWIEIESDRQYKLEMTITLGRCSRRKALKGMDLSSCLPDAELSDWVEVDMEKFLDRDEVKLKNLIRIRNKR